MKPIVFILFVFLFACGSGSEDSLCGVGDQYNVSGSDVCVYDIRVPAQASSSCPGALPIRAEWGDVFSCASTNLPDSFATQLEGLYPDANIELPTDAVCFTAEDVTLENVEVGSATIEMIEIENCGTTPLAVSLEEDAVFTLTPNRSSIQPGQTASFSLTIVVAEEGTFTTEIVLATDDDEKSIAVEVSTGNVDEDCPTANIVTEDANGMMGADLAVPINATGIVATFDGTTSVPTDGATINEYVWTLESQPVGSNVDLSEENGPTTSLATWTPGQYVISLDVIDSTGKPACDEATVTIDVVYADDLSVELKWRTPGDANVDDEVGSDLDLHVVHPDGLFADAVYDCFWNNENPEWGSAGATDNPMFVVEDRNGVGPEIVLLQSTEPVGYRVGVYYNSTGGYGASFATVRIFNGATLIAEELDEELTSAGKFWLVGTYDAANTTFTDDDLVIDGFPNF